MEEDYMTVIIAPTVRGLIKEANEKGVKKENIVSLLKENGQFMLVYFE